MGILKRCVHFFKKRESRPPWSALLRRSFFLHIAADQPMADTGDDYIDTDEDDEPTAKCSKRRDWEIIQAVCVCGPGNTSTRNDTAD